MKAIIVPPLSPEQQQELDSLYRTTKDPRLRTRAQMVLLSAEKQMKAGEIAEIVRESHVTVLLWLHRYLAEGVEGLQDTPSQREAQDDNQRVPGSSVRGGAAASAQLGTALFAVDITTPRGLPG